MSKPVQMKKDYCSRESPDQAIDRSYLSHSTQECLNNFFSLHRHIFSLSVKTRFHSYGFPPPVVGQTNYQKAPETYDIYFIKTPEEGKFLQDRSRGLMVKALVFGPY